MSHLTRILTSLAAVALLTACGGGEAPGGEAAGGEGVIDRAVEAAAEAVPGGYVEKLQVPSALPDDPAAELMAMAVRSATIPQGSAVSIPAYPGARLLSSSGSLDMATAQGESQLLPSLALLSGDDVGAVAAFYAERLSGWAHEEFYGSHIYWDGPEGSNPMDITGGFPSVAVIPLEGDDTETAMWPAMKTRIDVRFVPGS